MGRVVSTQSTFFFFFFFFFFCATLSTRSCPSCEHCYQYTRRSTTASSRSFSTRAAHTSRTLQNGAPAIEKYIGANSARKTNGPCAHKMPYVSQYCSRPHGPQELFQIVRAAYPRLHRRVEPGRGLGLAAVEPEHELEAEHPC